MWSTILICVDLQEHTRQSKRQKRREDRQSRRKRKYTVFPGRNSFYCGGHVVMAQKAGIFYLTLFLVVGTTALSFAFDARYLAIEVRDVRCPSFMQSIMEKPLFPGKS